MPICWVVLPRKRAACVASLSLAEPIIESCLHVPATHGHCARDDTHICKYWSSSRSVERERECLYILVACIVLSESVFIYPLRDLSLHALIIFVAALGLKCLYLFVFFLICLIMPETRRCTDPGVSCSNIEAQFKLCFTALGHRNLGEWVRPCRADCLSWKTAPKAQGLWYRFVGF